MCNRGFGGYTSRLVREDIEAGLISLPAPGCILAVTLLLGSNDHVLPHDPLHVSVDEYRANLSAIVGAIRARYGPSTPVLLLTPPPVDEVTFREATLHLTRQSHDGNGRGEERLAPYLQAAREAAASSECHLVEVHDRLAEMDDWKGLLGDGLHLNGKGHMAVYKLVAEALHKLGIAPVDLAVHRPHFLNRAFPDMFDVSGKMRR